MLKICKLKLLLVLAWYFPPFFAPPRILYTCSAQAEPDHETALGALDLAHRWQSGGGGRDLDRSTGRHPPTDWCLGWQLQNKSRRWEVD